MKVSDDDLALLHVHAANLDVGHMPRMSAGLFAALAELAALRRVADAAEAYVAADMDDYHTSSTTDLCAALTAAGR